MELDDLQTKILLELGQGFTVKELIKDLNITYYQYNKAIKSSMNILNVDDKIQAVFIAVRRKLI